MRIQTEDGTRQTNGARAILDASDNAHTQEHLQRFIFSIARWHHQKSEHEKNEFKRL